MQADEGAEIIVGFEHESSANEYLAHLDSKTLPSILKRIKVKPGEVYFLETGTIHAIGKGIVIAEIQQTSDITYRVYDWDRLDTQGNARELHIDLALEAINYNYVNAKRCYDKKVDSSNNIVKSNYFTTNFIPLSTQITISKNKDCFRVYIVITGNIKISITNDTSIYSFKKGDTLLIPANLTEYKIEGQAELLEIYIEY